MKKFILLIIAGIMACVCARVSGSVVHKTTRVDTSLTAAKLLTLADAEKIMGEKLHLIENSTKRDKGISTYLCGYQANTKDIKSGKTGAIYFLLDQFDQVSAAKKKYAETKTANEHNGIKTLNDLGDEAYFHTDNQNFYFIMVRKGTKVFNIKVNKITHTTSLENFNQVARKIAAAI
jgi:hypothetical protein